MRAPAPDPRESDPGGSFAPGPGIGYMAASERAVFDLSLGEMLVIGVLVIVFVGPDGLPDMMRVLGRFYGQVRRASDDLRRTFNAEVARVEADRRREELRQRRAERERLREATRAEAESSEEEEETPDEPLPADPRLPPDAAPRYAPRPAGTAGRPAAAAPPPAAPTPPAQPSSQPSRTEPEQ